MIAEASRAKHKFAVKRNSWPKTRGVAMNPVDHVCCIHTSCATELTCVCNSPTVAVIINTLAKLLRSLDTPHKVKRPVLLLHVGRVYSAVLKRSRTRGTICLMRCNERRLEPRALDSSNLRQYPITCQAGHRLAFSRRQNQPSANWCCEHKNVCPLMAQRLIEPVVLIRKKLAWAPVRFRDWVFVSVVMHLWSSGPRMQLQSYKVQTCKLRSLGPSAQPEQPRRDQFTPGDTGARHSCCCRVAETCAEL